MTSVNTKNIVILLILALSLALIVIDSTVVNITLPAIQADFSVSVNDLEWISSIYALFFGSFILTWGKLGDQFGRRRIFMGGVTLFIVGSAIDGLSANLSMMLLGRAIQGFGSAMASPSTLSILTTTFTGRARSVAFGVWGAVAGASGALGPLLGGYFTTYDSWRWAFLINVPIGLVALIGALIVIKESKFKTPNYTTDYGGVTLITLSLSALIFGLIEGQTYGWLAEKQTFTALGFIWPFSNFSLPAFSIVSGTLLLLLFIYYEIKRQHAGKDPLFEFSLLKFTGFRFGILTVLIVAVGEFGVFFILSLYLQIVRGLSAIETGITFLPMAITLLISAPLAGLLASRVGPKWIVTTGMTLEGIALLAMSQVITISFPIYYLYPVLIVYGAGVGLAVGQLTNTVLTSIPWQKAGIGSGANNTVRQIGAAFGVAIIGAVLVAVMSSGGQADLNASAVIPDALKASIAKVFDSGLTGGIGFSMPFGVAGTPVGDAIKTVFNDAITQGTRSAALTAGIFCGGGAVCSLLIPNAKKADGSKSSEFDQHQPASEATA